MASGPPLKRLKNIANSSLQKQSSISTFFTAATPAANPTSPETATTSTSESKLAAVVIEGFNVQEVPGDGNCQFAAIACQLQRFGILTSASTVRTQIVDRIRSHPHLVNIAEQHATK